MTMLSWIIVTIFLLSIMLCSIAKMFDFIMEPEFDALRKHIKDIEGGRCPHCGALHPGAVGNGTFWKTFNCPECGYKMNIHIKTDNEGTR